MGVATPDTLGETPGINDVDPPRDCEGANGPEEPEDDSGIWKLCRTLLRRDDPGGGVLMPPKLMGGGVCNPDDDPGGVYCPVGGGVYLE